MELAEYIQHVFIRWQIVIRCRQELYVADLWSEERSRVAFFSLSKPTEGISVSETTILLVHSPAVIQNPHLIHNTSLA